MKTQNILGAALLGLACSFPAAAQVAVPGATTTAPGSVATPVSTGVIAPGQPSLSGALPSGAVVPGAGTTPVGATSGSLNTNPAGGTLYSGASQSNTPAGTMSTAPGSSTPSGSSTTRRTTTGRTSTTKARP